ncbi:MAG: hypothetical protein M1608_01585, partial [Candidatus Omnitrophica bacterium]|nr:hypothetical protein [Candidatus Omnitrophota bacterium]
KSTEWPGIRSCERAGVIYNPLMKKSSRRVLLAIGAVLLLGSGCGGFSGAHTISPASFFLPGARLVPPAQPAGLSSQATMLARNDIRNP